ncbi:MAG: pantetheine-phosphate adenylyltransferase [Syntrophobacterales bacterium]|nr:MAG: pantetheine-phosphate adenylyltransferase [Syntrophobacterales bacterium]
MGKIAVYPGSFDPITYGHIDIIERGLEIFDGVIVAIADNAQKKNLFTIDERVEMAKIALREMPDVVVENFSSLLVDYVEKTNAGVILRGLRATSDFEYEFHMAHMNKTLNKRLDTLFMMTGRDYFFISSRTIKEVASLGGDVNGLVPEIVVEHLRKKFKIRRSK